MKQNMDKSTLGDLKLFYFNYLDAKAEIRTLVRSRWMNHPKERLLPSLSELDLDIRSDTVQGCRNKIENKLTGLWTSWKS
jgi:hypothetical protein